MMMMMIIHQTKPNQTKKKDSLNPDVRQPSRNRHGGEKRQHEAEYYDGDHDNHGEE